VKAFLVSHTHWDREWYRTFEAFRARLVDTIDRLLALVAEDPGYRFLLDGQTIVLEDYLAVRPERRKDVEAAVRDGRVAIGPWYVQPDSLLPSGEAHVRNLLEGRRSGAAFGPVSSVAYTPDSFGHPAQFPQLFAGFGLRAFVYWRGNPSALAAFPPEYRWQAPDGSSVVGCHLGAGYFNAGNVALDPAAAAGKIAHVAEKLVERTRQERVLLMNGFDHAAPCAEAGAIAAALAERTGWDVRRALVDDFVDGIAGELPVFRGELVGGTAGPLLPGVWSARLPLKLRNRRCEIALERLAEPFAALAQLYGLADERPSLRAAWRELLRNQAHDSIGGCSIDRVHAQMEPRYDTCEELARETTLRALERLSGHGVARATPSGDAIELAVWNPSPFPRAGVARFALDPWPSMQSNESGPFFHRWLLPPREGTGFRADGVPARVVAGNPDGRFLIAAASEARDLELVVGEIPAFGWRRVRLEAVAEAAPDVVDAEREIACGDVAVRAADDGTLSVRFGARELAGLCALEDAGDRGDSYDADPLEPGAPRVQSVAIERRRHASGIEELEIVRVLRVPRALDPSRERRASELADVRVAVRARVAPGEPGVALSVRVERAAEDHRLRLLFPTGAPCAGFLAATTFDTIARSTAPLDATGWIHPPPATFPQQGFVCANGLAVVAPGLPEAEVRPDGAIALTVLRAVGWLSRADLRSRPGPAGPQLAVPGAQTNAVEAELRLLDARDTSRVASDAREIEAPLQAVTIAGAPLAPENTALVALEPRTLVLSACKPAEHGDGLIVRVQNPGNSPVRARLRTGFALSAAHALRLDESDAGFSIEFAPASVSFDVPPHALRTVRLVASGTR